jgi:hypothetical protein
MHIGEVEAERIASIATQTIEKRLAYNCDRTPIVWSEYCDSYQLITINIEVYYFRFDFTTYYSFALYADEYTSNRDAESAAYEAIFDILDQERHLSSVAIANGKRDELLPERIKTIKWSSLQQPK